jgi:multiple sugar transport system substrate-binding protein
MGSRIVSRRAVLKAGATALLLSTPVLAACTAPAPTPTVPPAKPTAAPAAPAAAPAATAAPTTAPAATTAPTTAPASQPAAAPTAKPAAAPTAAPAATKPAAREATVEFWAISGDEIKNPKQGTSGDIVARYLKRFTETNPTVKVNVTSTATAYAEHYTKMAAALAAGTAGDVIDVAADIQRHASKGFLVDLDDKVKAWRREDTFPAALDAMKWQGKLYGMPYLGLPRCLTYRKDVFVGAGLDPAKPPTNWDELVTTATKLTKTTAGEVSRAGHNIMDSKGGEIKSVQIFAWQNGGSWFDAANTKLLINSPENVEAFQFVQDLVLKHQVAPKGGVPATAGWSLANDKIALNTHFGPIDIARMRRENPDKLAELVVAPIFGKKRKAQFAAFQSTQVNAKTKFRDESLALLELLTGDDFQVDYNEFVGTTPVQEHLKSAKYIQADARFGIAMDTYKDSINEPQHDRWIPIRDTVLSPMFEAILIGQGTVKQAADNAQAEGEKILAAR